MTSISDDDFITLLLLLWMKCYNYRAQERLADILKVCVVKNAADRAAVSQLFVSTLDRLGVCPELGGPTKGV